MRLIDISLLVGDRRRRNLHCSACGGATWHDKPYCCEHVERMPYVTRIVADLEALAAERRLAAAGRRVPRDGFMAAMVLHELACSGELTVAGLARRMDWSRAETLTVLRSIGAQVHVHVRNRTRNTRKTAWVKLEA